VRLLIVDDEYYSAEGIKAKIAAYDFRELGGPLAISLAYTLAQAQAVFAETPPDIVITDIEMPKGSGLELVAWIRKERPQTVCVFLTSYAKFDYASEAVRLQGLDYLLKPVEESELMDCVGRAIERVREILAVQSRDDAFAEEFRLRNSPEPYAPTAAGAVRRVCSYIKEHIGQDMTRDQLAAIAYVSPDYLSHIFREHLGDSLTNYILDQRIRRAKEMLRHTDQSIRDIALTCGFQNISYFAKQFKRATGKTPQTYRTQK